PIRVALGARLDAPGQPGGGVGVLAPGAGQRIPGSGRLRAYHRGSGRYDAIGAAPDTHPSPLPPDRCKRADPAAPRGPRDAAGPHRAEPTPRAGRPLALAATCAGTRA